MPTLRLLAAVRDDLVAMARAGLPHEVCGYLVAEPPDEPEHVDVVRVVPVRNAARSPVAFALDPAGMLDAEAHIDRDGGRIVGLVHSHPTSAAVPSATDLADAEIYDPVGAWVQLIVSLQGFAPSVRAWRYPEAGGGGEPVELPLTILDRT